MASQLQVGNKTYVRLPGRAKRMFGLFTNENQRLYLGDDHLFVATTSYYYERYKRFYLADIQSLTIQKTADGGILNVVIGTIAGIFAAIAAAGFTSQWDSAAVMVLIVIAGVFTGMALINTAFGPTCQCHILTAVHEEPLYCLGRLYTAQRVVEYLRTVIEGVQGSIGNMADGTVSAAQRVERATERRGAALMVRSDSGRLHMALFGVLIFDAILGTMHIFFREGWPVAVGLASNIAIIVLVIAAAIRQRDSDIPRSVRASLWVALVFNMLMMATSMYIAAFMQVLVQNGNADASTVVESQFIRYANIVNLLVNMPTGFVGLYNIRVWRTAASARTEQQRVAVEESAQP